MFHLRQPSFTCYAHQSYPTDHNPYYSNVQPFSQPVITSDFVPEPTLHPPGMDPYSNSTSYPLTHVGLENRAQYCHDPNAGPQSWVVREAGAVRYDPPVAPLHEKSLMCTSVTSSVNTHWTNEPSLNSNTTTKLSKVIQPVCCEICGIDCNSRDVFDRHIMGKKHRKNVVMKNNSSANKIILPRQVGGPSGQIMYGALGLSSSHELEAKKQKVLNGGASVDSIRICNVCNVACNSQEVFNKHLAGKKHAAQAGLVALNGVGPYFAAIRAYNNSGWQKRLKKPKLVQSAWCEVCKINCNSNDVYVKHISGKKHQKNLESFAKSNTTSTSSTSSATPVALTNPVIGLMEKPDASTSKGDSSQISQKLVHLKSPEEDLETKKRKILLEGAAAGSVRVCTICNVVCNSQMVFNSHLAGQKHASMVKKQTEASTATTAPGVCVAS